MHVPVNYLEHALEDVEEAAGAMDLEAFLVIFARVRGDESVQLPHQPVQDVDVHDAKQDQEGSGDGGADDAAHAGEAVEFIGDGGGGAGDDDGGDHDNT